MVPALLSVLLLMAGPARAEALAEPQYLTLSAQDGTQLSLGLFARAKPRPSPEASARQARARLLLVAPGFGQRAGTETMRFMAGLLTPSVDVAVLDFRGTGQSHGEYNFGAEERQDLQAALAWAQAHYRSVDCLGLSMGGYISVVAVAEGPLRPQRLLLVSPPTRVEDVAWSFGFLAHPMGLLWNRHKEVLHGSVDPFFTWGSLFAPKPKAEVAAKGLAVPAHFLVGGRDLLVFKRLTRKIYEAVPGEKTWTEWPEGGHAEHMALEDPPAFAAWVGKALEGKAP